MSCRVIPPFVADVPGFGKAIQFRLADRPRDESAPRPVLALPSLAGAGAHPEVLVLTSWLGRGIGPHKVVEALNGQSPWNHVTSIRLGP